MCKIMYNLSYDSTFLTDFKIKQLIMGQIPFT